MAPILETNQGTSDQNMALHPGASHVVGVYPGTFKTYIDLRSDDFPESKASSPIGYKQRLLTSEDRLLYLLHNSSGISSPSNLTSPNGVTATKTNLLCCLSLSPESAMSQMKYGQPTSMDNEDRKFAQGSPSGKSSILEAEITKLTSSGTISMEYDGRSPDKTLCPMTAASAPSLNLDILLADQLLPDTQAPFPNPPCCALSNFNESEGFEAALPRSNTLSDTPIQNKLPCRERKRIIVPSNRPPRVTKAMKLWIARTHALLDPFREDDECWLHPSPPPARITANGTCRPCGKIQKAFTWQDRTGKHAIVLNFGIVSKLLNHKITKQQKDGLINRQWHLSHLCGNWPCLNPTHTIVEPGGVNISRNSCFSHRVGCAHNPQCMKEKKVPLSADGKQIDHGLLMDSGSSAGVGGWDGWANNFDDWDDTEDADSVEPRWVENGVRMDCFN